MTTLNNVTKNIPLPLPATAEDHLQHRIMQTQRTLNDMVEETHLQLIEDDKYRDYLNAVWDEQAVEGSLSADNIMAATMIRTKAVKMGNAILAREKLATISKSLGVVLRRYEFSRKQRRNTVGGEVVRDDQ
jgi:hypothetical protein